MDDNPELVTPSGAEANANNKNEMSQVGGIWTQTKGERDVSHGNGKMVGE